jgi:uncharacterized protein YjbI with pentapeptide repeats
MKHKLDGSGLLLTTRDQLADSACLVVTAGLLVDSASGVVLPTEDSWEWITQRFAGMAFDRGLKKSVGTFAVHGKAYALTEAQGEGVAVQVQVGPRQKRLHVFAPRIWRKGLLGWSAVLDGRLGTVPLDFEHAFGGTAYSDNPDGQGYVFDEKAYADSSLAQIESADFPVRDPGDHPLPATFLPLPPQSSARTGFMGTLDEHWKARRAPWLPLDTDPRWFNEVAQDQCHEHYWCGDETWSVSGLHPQHPHISGTLPGLRPRLFVEYCDSARPIVEAPLDLDTLWLFPDAERLLLLYRVQILVSDADAEDVAALGLGCERRDDPVLSTQAWIDHLWPCGHQSHAEAGAAPTPPEFAPQQTMCCALQAAADRIYADVLQGFEQSIEAAKKMAARTGQHFDPQLFKPPVRLDIATMIAQGPGPSENPFDPAAHEAQIRAAMAQGEAEARTHVEQIANRLKLMPQALYVQAATNSQTPADAASLMARLPLAATEKASLQTQVAAGLTQAKTLEADINGKIAAMRQQLADSAASLPTPPKMDMAAPVDWSREQIKASNEAGQSLAGQRFVKLDLSELDLTTADLRGSHFEGCQLQGSKLNAADMRKCVFIECSMNGVELQRTQLDGAFFQRCCLDGGKLAGASIKLGYAQSCSFVQAQLTQADFSDGQCVDCDFYKADLKGSMTARTRFQNCVLDAVCALDANMVNSQWHACTVDDLRLENANLQGAAWSRVNGLKVDASGANLDNLRVDQACQLPSIRFDKANLHNASLQHANLRGASLRGACLDHALISRCDLRDSDGYHLAAREADFTGSDLSGARWVGANLMDARLRKVTLDSTDLSGSNLYAAYTEAARGTQVQLDHALLGQCRLKEDLTRA